MEKKMMKKRKMKNGHLTADSLAIVVVLVLVLVLVVAAADLD